MCFEYTYLRIIALFYSAFILHGQGQQVHPLFEGDVIDLGGRMLEVVGLPGHTPGSIGFLDTTHRILISGDPIQKNGRIFMFGPQRNFPAYIASLKRLSKWDDKYDELWPSHADLPVQKEMIEKLIVFAEEVYQGKVIRGHIEMFGHPVDACSTEEITLLINQKEN